MSSDPFLSNDLFLLYSDVVLDKKYSWEDVHQKMGVLHHPVIFIKTELLEYYLPWLLTLSMRYVLLTTCNDDYCMPYYSFPPSKAMKESHDRLLNHDKMMVWMTKNPSIVHPKVQGIPLGPKWQYQSYDFFGEDKTPILYVLHRYCLTPEIKFHSEKMKLVYVNFDVGTSMTPFYQPHRNIRGLLLNACIQQGFQVSSPKKYEAYLQELQTYKFCMCPPGRGIDTHRVLECLMVGTIPIMVTGPMDAMYEGLPVLWITNVAQISKTYLEKEYLVMKTKKYEFEKLYAPYWKKRLRAYPDLNRDYESQSLVC